MLLAKNNNVFDTFFGDPWFNDPWFDDRDIQKAQKKLYGHNEKKLMLTDIKESDKGYELEMDLPGFKKEEIKASIENGYLVISAEKGLEMTLKRMILKHPSSTESFTWTFRRNSLSHRLKRINLFPSRDKG